MSTLAVAAHPTTVMSSFAAGEVPSLKAEKKKLEDIFLLKRQPD